MSQKFAVHPIALLFPRPTDDERAALKESIRRFGFRDPVVGWKGPDGVDYVIDGATRKELRDEFEKDGVTAAENGALLDFDVAWFVGTEREALEHAFAKQQRRNLSQSQKAAVAIMTDGMMQRLSAKERNEDAALIKVQPAGEVAERVAKMAGTNKTYVYAMAAIHAKYPAITEKVAAGIYSLPQAEKAAKRLEAGLAEKDDGSDPPPVETPVAPAKPSGVFDGFKRLVHPNFNEVFGVRKEVARIRKELAKLVKDAQAVADGPGGRSMSLSAVKTDVNNARKHLELHQPHCVCPMCAGLGVQHDKPAEKCLTCDGRCYIDIMQFDALPENVRKMVEGTTAPADAAPAVESAAAPATADTGATADPNATATREFAPGELTPDQWDEDGAAVPDEFSELPDAPAGANEVVAAAAAPVVSGVAPQPAPAGEPDPFDL